MLGLLYWLEYRKSLPKKRTTKMTLVEKMQNRRAAKTTTFPVASSSLAQKMRDQKNLPCPACKGYVNPVCGGDRVCRCAVPEPKPPQVTYPGPQGSGQPYVHIENLNWSDPEDIHRLTGHCRLDGNVKQAALAYVQKRRAGWPSLTERAALLTAIHTYHAVQADVQEKP